MNQDKSQSNEEKAAEVLKEVYQDAQNKPVSDSDSGNEQPNAEDTADQLKGSDADTDENVGFDDQSSSEETGEELKGSDADKAE